MHKQEIEFRYRTLWDRVGAYVLDALLLIPILFGIEFFINGNADEGPQFIIDIISTIVWALYLIIAQGWFGTTLGKKILNLKVTTLEGLAPIGFKKAFLREIIWIIPHAIIFLVYFFFNDPFKTISFEESLDYNLYIIIVGLIVVVLKLVTVSRDPKRRGIHDKMSGTVVVRDLLKHFNQE